MADSNATSDERRGALDVPTTNYDDLVTVNQEGYFEDENHRPEPLYQYGTVDTSDTGGAAHQSVAEVSPVFEEARVRNLVTAARALDPDDDGVGSEMVILPEGSVTVTGSTKSVDDARAEIEGKLKSLADEPVVLGAAGPQQRAAAEEAEDTSNPDVPEGVRPGANPAPATATTAASTSQQAAAAPSGTSSAARARASRGTSSGSSSGSSSSSK
jgi:hypothetical protein